MGATGAQLAELEVRLARLTTDRLRLLLPILIFALLVAWATSESVGIPITLAVIVVNLAALAVVAGLYAWVRLDRVPVRLAGAVAAATALIAPITTFTAQVESGVSGLSMIVMIELAASSLQISSRWMIATTVMIVGAWVPLWIRDGGAHVTFHFTSVVSMGVVATIVQVMLRRGLIQTELARIQEAAMRDQLIHAQRMEAVGTLAAGLAHDMNNILAGVMSSAELIALDCEDQHVRDDCARIVHEAERGASLTRSLLAFSRRGQYRKEPVRLDAITGSIEALLSRTLPKTIEIEQVGDARPIVNADAVQVGQALVNLCLNGADAMNGTGKLTITREERALTAEDIEELKLPMVAGDLVAVLSVSDTGHGMDEATRTRAFEPFFTTKPLGKGTGLGLSMVYGTVTGHDGAIRVKSSPGKGTTFELVFPVTESSVTPRPARAPARDFTGAKLVLVVDDEPLVQEATRRILEKMGLSVVVASDGVDALHEFGKRSEEIGLVVLDMAMPRMSGPECFRRLREASQVPILIASGYALAEETQALLTMAPAGFIEKPFTASQLSVKVEQLLFKQSKVPAWQAANESRF